MEFFGFFAFVLMMIYFDLPDKVKKLKGQVKKLEQKTTKGGVIILSDILKELQGKKCTIIAESGYTPKLNCTVMAVDEEWIKVVETDKKGKENTRVFKIENIKEIHEIE